MTSADDFHLISWRNFLGLSAVVIGVLIPVGLRYVFKKQAIELPTDNDDNTSIISDPVLAQGPAALNKGKNVQQERMIVLGEMDEEDMYEDELEGEEDEILESGPPPFMKGKENARDGDDNHDESAPQDNLVQL